MVLVTGRRQWNFSPLLAKLYDPTLDVSTANGEHGQRRVSSMPPLR